MQHLKLETLIVLPKHNETVKKNKRGSRRFNLHSQNTITQL